MHGTAVRNAPGGAHARVGAPRTARLRPRGARFSWEVVLVGGWGSVMPTMAAGPGPFHGENCVWTTAEGPCRT
jgi:hypothetical protein